ncbi:MAG: GIY-YIG nuclease family protein [Chloroflexi bacterium]|nr:GIY-YIG nuclease family protein [Chloroflexota bacterium]
MSTPGRPKLPAGRGGYALVFRLDSTIRVRPGRLGVIELSPGHYLYMGSALSGLAPRIARHLRRRKKRHWHIDALSSAVRPEQVWWAASEDRLECRWTRAVLEDPGASWPVGGFGASDCRCTSHLVRLESPAALESAWLNLVYVSPGTTRLDTPSRGTRLNIS